MSIVRFRPSWAAISSTISIALAVNGRSTLKPKRRTAPTLITWADSMSSTTRERAYLYQPLRRSTHESGRNSPNASTNTDRLKLTAARHQDTAQTKPPLHLKKFSAKPCREKWALTIPEYRFRNRRLG